MQTETVISERQACRLVGIYRSTLRYEARQTAENQALSTRIVELAQARRRFGYRRIHALLRREGHEVNHKRVYRLYSAANLAVKRRKRRKGVMVPREPLTLPTQRNEVWSMAGASRYRPSWMIALRRRLIWCRTLGSRDTM